MPRIQDNVLGILVGYSELLLMDIPEESPLRRHIDQILQGGIRASAIVQDLLTLARRGVHSERVISLNALISDFIHTPECEALFSRNAQIRFKRELSPDLLCIRGSTPHLFKTLLNLMTNALEAMPEGGWVTVATANRHLEKPVHGYDSVREGDYAVLTISDTGEGIAEEDIRHIFEPFYTKKVMGRSGTGLGLAVVWGTVKDHNGYIDVQSELGIGTTFTLYFPVTRDEMEASQSAAPISVYTGNGETLLVVDDMEEQRDLAARMLGKLNYRVTTLPSGEAATAFLQTNRVDLVILDMIMEPGMDGLDTFKKIREIHPDQKAIIVSGYASTERVTQAHALGAGGYVKKPYVLETLGLAVKKELASSS
jgi:CheY-like chemotaxis protein